MAGLNPHLCRFFSGVQLSDDPVTNGLCDDYL